MREAMVKAACGMSSAARASARRRNPLLQRKPLRATDPTAVVTDRACKYFAAFRGGSGRAWLLQIVRNAAYSTLKAQRRRMEISLSSGMRAADEDRIDKPRAGNKRSLVSVWTGSGDPAITRRRRKRRMVCDQAYRSSNAASMDRGETATDLRNCATNDSKPEHR